MGKGRIFGKQKLQHLVYPIVMGKETRYFTRGTQEEMRILSGGNLALSAKWFLNIFPRKPEHADANISYMTGDASPQYIEEPFVTAPAIHKMFPSAKIILLLREPVS